MSAATRTHPAEPPVRSADAPAPLSPGDLAELISSFTDVTARLQGTHEMLRAEVARLEGELREAHAQLSRARQLAALGEMAAGIAHEVRNPLGSIRLYASMLTQDLADRPSECETAGKIAAAVSRLDAIVGDVLTFARDMEVRLRQVPAASLLADAVDACADLWRSRGVAVRLPDESRLAFSLHCDPVLMHQALVNVLRNAAEAAGEGPGGVVWVHAERRRVLWAGGRRGPAVAISVRDNGPGVPPEALSRLFNPFFTTRHTGTGLGLAIVHRIVDAHAGRVVISNNTSPGQSGEPPRGATVEFHIPLRAAGAREQRQEAA